MTVAILPKRSISILPRTSIFEKGGAGSGDFGHAGRPGEVGGSGEGGGFSAEDRLRTGKIKSSKKLGGGVNDGAPVLILGGGALTSTFPIDFCTAV